MKTEIADALKKIKVCWQNNGLSINLDYSRRCRECG